MVLPKSLVVILAAGVQSTSGLVALGASVGEAVALAPCDTGCWCCGFSGRYVALGTMTDGTTGPDAGEPQAAAVSNRQAARPKVKRVKRLRTMFPPLQLVSASRTILHAPSVSQIQLSRPLFDYLIAFVFVIDFTGDNSDWGLGVQRAQVGKLAFAFDKHD